MAAGLQAGEVEAVMRLLGDVPDPEIPVVSVVDLGMVRGVRAAPPTVLLTPTFTGCPAADAIRRAVRSALDREGFERVAVEIMLAPPWTTDWISDEGRDRLRAYGIAPPPKGAALARLRQQAVACPRCGSADTAEISRFGSTPCKALWSCRACLEPFDHFKCH